jgi:hypothetical protein
VAQRCRIRNRCHQKANDQRPRRKAKERIITIIRKEEGRRRPPKKRMGRVLEVRLKAGRIQKQPKLRFKNPKRLPDLLQHHDRAGDSPALQPQVLPILHKYCLFQ